MQSVPLRRLPRRHFTRQRSNMSFSASWTLFFAGLQTSLHVTSDAYQAYFTETAEASNDISLAGSSDRNQRDVNYVMDMQSKDSTSLRHPGHPLTSSTAQRLST